MSAQLQPPATEKRSAETPREEKTMDTDNRKATACREFLQHAITTHTGRQFCTLTESQIAQLDGYRVIQIAGEVRAQLQRAYPGVF